MAGITLAQAEAKLATWMAAEDKLANGVEARQGDRVLKYADLSEVREQITYWEGKCNDLSSGDGSGNIVPKSIIPLG